MIATGLVVFAQIAMGADIEGDFFTKVEASRLVGSEGKTIPRVERDDQGNVIRLQLNQLQLSRDDVAVLSRLATLRSLTLFETNVTDADLQHLGELSKLEGLNLTSTEITDAAVDHIMKLKSLRSLCLGNVNVSPEAVARLKEHFRTQGRRLSLGYGQRK